MTTALRRLIVAVGSIAAAGVLVSLPTFWPTSAVTFAQTAATAPPTAPAPSSADRGWRRLQSTNFDVVGNSPEGILRNTALQLELFRDTVSRLFPALREPSPRPTRVVVFKNDASFHEFKPRDPRGRLMDTVAGYLTAQPEANYIVLAARINQTQTDRVVLHEFAHYLIHGAAPRVPRWLDEGLADYYSTLLVDVEDGSARIGNPIREHLARLRRGLIIRVDQLLSTPGETTVFRDMRLQVTFYAQSWALVHYLTLGHGGKRDGQLETYLQATAAGRSLEDAGRQAFGTDLEELHLELATYVRRYNLPTQSFARPPNDRPIVARRAMPMPEAAVQALRADLLKRVPVFGEAGEATPRVTVEPHQMHPSTPLP